MSNTISAGMRPLKKHSLTCGNMPTGVACTSASKERCSSCSRVTASAPQILASARTRSGLRPTRVILRARIGESAGCATGSTAVSRDQHGGIAQAEFLPERHRDAGHIGISASPFASLAPNGIYRANAPRQRIDYVQIAENFLLMGNRHAEARDRQFFGKAEEIAHDGVARPETANRRPRCDGIERRDCAPPEKSNGARDRQ